MYLPSDPNSLTAITPETVFMDVVGVIREIKLLSLTQDEQQGGACFFPVAQNMPPPQAPAIAFNYAVRTTGDPRPLGQSIRQVVNGLDRELAVSDTLVMTERVDRSLTDRRLPMVLAVGFGTVGLFLSAVGIYGVLAYVVAQRRREIGVRMALGSSRWSIFDLIMREGLVLLAVGFAVGALGAFALRRTLESQLYGIAPTDPIVIALIASILAVVAIVACALPAQRATMVDPVVALSE